MAYDITIRGAEIVDGSGGARRSGDIGVRDGRIEEIGHLTGAGSGCEINGEGLVAAPGFIDVHTHDDFAALIYPDMGFKIRGGVTTSVVGNCGFGAAPFTEACVLGKAMHPDLSLSPYDGYRGYMEALSQSPPGVNIGVLAGHGTLRLAAMGTDDRSPDDHEMQTMHDLFAEGLEAGVLGLSTGLIYEPGRYAKRDEIIELAGDMRGTHGLYATHMRNEGEGLLESVAEAIEIGDAAGVDVQISHHKASGRDSWGLVSQSLRLIEQAQARGESVHADQYPYTAGSTILRAVLENGAFIPGASGGFGSLRPEDLVIASAAEAGDWEGLSLAAIAAELGMPPRQAAEHVLSVSSDATVIVHMMSEDDVQRVMQHPSTMIGSDGIPTLNGKPHPRLYNSFARVVGHYGRDKGLFSLENAVYRMTGFAAEKFRLKDRGVLQVGAHADIVLFDPASIIDRGTFEEPNRVPDGIHTVIVNGQIAMDSEGSLRGRHGRPLTRQQ